MAKRTRKTAAGRGASPGGDRAKLEAPIPRLKQVEDWLGTGLSHGDVVKLATTTFGISMRTAERDISKVLARWENEDEGDRPAKRARMRAELWGLYHEGRRLMRLHEEGGGDDVEEENQGGSIDGGAVVATLRVRKRRLPRPKDCLDCARILERLAKLDGLEAPVKVEVKGTDSATEMALGMTPQQREDRIAELIAKRLAAAAEGPEPAMPEPRRPRVFDPGERVRGKR